MFLFRILLPLILLVSIVAWLIEPSRRTRSVALTAAFLAVIFSAITLAMLVLDTSGQEEPPVTTPLPSIAPAPTRPPDSPGYKTACDTFWTLNKDIEDDALLDGDERAARMNEFKRTAEFPGVTPQFTGLVNDYIDAVEVKFAPPSGSLNVDEIELEIRRARNRITSECLRREG